MSTTEEKVIERVSKISAFGHSGKKGKVSILKALFKNPDDFELHAYVQNGEVVIKIKEHAEE